MNDPSFLVGISEVLHIPSRTVELLSLELKIIESNKFRGYKIITSKIVNGKRRFVTSTFWNIRNSNFENFEVNVGRTSL